MVYHSKTQTCKNRKKENHWGWKHVPQSTHRPTSPTQQAESCCWPVSLLGCWSCISYTHSFLSSFSSLASLASRLDQANFCTKPPTAKEAKRMSPSFSSFQFHLNRRLSLAKNPPFFFSGCCSAEGSAWASSLGFGASGSAT